MTKILQPKVALLVGALSLLASLTRQARIGYTLQQRIAKYGKEAREPEPSGKGYSWHHFRVNGVTIGCVFIDGEDSGRRDVLLEEGPVERLRGDKALEAKFRRGCVVRRRSFSDELRRS